MSRKKTSRAGSSRFTVCLPDPLMRVLDRLRTARRYGNRSEFVRGLLRADLAGRSPTSSPNLPRGHPLRGPARETQQVANRLLSVKGVRSATAR